MIATILANDDVYTGLEPAVNEFPPALKESRDIIYIRPRGLSNRAIPLFDSELHIVTGYAETMSGVSRIYDLDGTMVGMEEKPLESPPFAPEDIIFLVGSLARFGFKALLGTGIRALSAEVTKATLYILRQRFMILKPLSLKFTNKTILHMNDPNRFVPVQILILAIKHGKKIADPQAAVGATKYVINMMKNGKEYILHVVVREMDQTILHFHYAPLK